MTLHHIAQGAGAVVIAGALFNAGGFGMNDLHMIDVVAVPQRFEHEIGETEYQDVLDSALTQIVIDAEYLIFTPVAMQTLVENLGAFEVVAEGFFQHHAPPTVVVAVQARGREAIADHSEFRRRQRHIEGDIGWVIRAIQ